MRPIRFTSSLAVIGIVFIWLTPSSLAYEVHTHKQLTEATIDLFNENFPEHKIEGDSKKALIAGSEEEDTAPRHLFHFYDPVNKKGLTIKKNSWLTSKAWAEDEQKQISLKIQTFFANLPQLSVPKTNFTWQEAFNQYNKGDKVKAMNALGHVLHLLQDASVPAHTRNDPHVEGDSYEKFAGEQKTIDWQGRKLVELDRLANYFDDLANYSNNNFYSKDTIGLKGYKAPQPDYLRFYQGHYYGVKRDSQGEYFLSRKSGSSLLFANRYDITIDTPIVLHDYWQRLSPKAVSYGAGVIHLFLNTLGEKLEVTQEKVSDSKKSAVDEGSQKNEPDSKPKDLSDEEVIEGAMRSLENTRLALLDLQNRLGGVGGMVVEDFEEEVIKDIKEEEIKEEPQDEAESLPEEKKDVEPEPQPEEMVEDAPIVRSGTTVSSDPVVYIKKDFNGPKANNIVISEFLFDVEGNDKGLEFVELYNPTEEVIDLSEWSIQTSSKKKNFENDNMIAAKGFFLIWLGDSEIANMIWKSGSLKNTEDFIYLVDNQEVVIDNRDPNIIDLVNYRKEDFQGFVAGSSLERVAWQDNVCLGQQGIGGMAGDVCDSGIAMDDFLVQKSPNPQTTEVVLAPEADWLKSLTYFKDPRDETTYLIDITFDEYPFIPGEYDGWKIIAFYKDSNPTADETISTSDAWAPTDTDNLLSVRFPNYSGASVRKSLILPSTSEGFGNGGGVMNAAYNLNYLEDNRIRLETDEEVDYLTLAFYEFVSSGAGSQNFKLIGVNTTKHYRETGLSDLVAPLMTGDVVVEFDRSESILLISWPEARDDDTRDALLTYEIKINDLNTGEEEVITTSATSYKKRVKPGDSLIIEVRAEDEFGAISSSKSVEWSYPLVELVIDQDQANDWSYKVGNKNPNCSRCPIKASLQSVKLTATQTIDLVNIKLIQSGTYGGGARLQVFSDLDGGPDFGQLLGSRTLPNIYVSEDEYQLTFIFDQPITFKKDKLYWLVLDSRYSDGRAYYRSSIKNAVATGDLYTSGVLGLGHSGDCADYDSSYCSFVIPYIEDVDWFMKIGFFK